MPRKPTSAERRVFLPLPPAAASRHRTTLLDRFAADRLDAQRAAVFGAYAALLVGPVAAGVAALRGYPGWVILLALVVGGPLGGALAAAISLAVAQGAGAGFAAFIQPNGASAPAQPDFSFEESLAARGDTAAATEAYEAAVLSHPGSVAARLRAADFFAAAGRAPGRAAELYREARGLPGVGPGDDIYAANRLVDLYVGPLRDPGKALVELRRLADRYRGTEVAERARAALVRLKSETDLTPRRRR
jgi:hypothetical protein